MVDMDILASRGVSTEKWKTLFESDKPSEKLEQFKKRMWRRCNDGITSNLTSWKVYRAIDAAWDTPLRQITPTLLINYAGQNIANDKPKDNVLKVFQSLDLTQYIVDELDLKTGKPTGRKTLDLPTFFKLIIPLVKPYVTIRWAKLCNDRNTDPMFKYDPVRNTPKERVRCAVLTSRVNLMANQYNYADIRKQSILGMLLYPECYQFIETEWHEERQLKEVGGAEEEVVVREGLTYHRPHPTRVYRDESYPGFSLLSDTGCRWIGYWRVKRYGELEDDPKYWNKGKVAIGGTNWTNDYAAYFTAFASCTMQFPTVNTDNNNDVQVKLGNNFYVSDHRDMGVMVTEHFEKIVPSQCGLGDYDYEIWARFCQAGDGTVIYAAPLPGTPVLYYGDCVDANRVSNSSLALDIVPFEDTLTNLLTQLILSSKQNLGGVTWCDTALVNEEDIKEMENKGEVFYRMRKFFRYNSRNARAQQLNARDAIFTTNFPWIDLNGLVMTFNIILNMLERVIQISPQEVGSSASHEQSKAEVDYVNRSTANRLAFTSSAIDRATDAWKRQIYEYLMAYGEEEVYAQLSIEEIRDIGEQALNDMGFTVEEHGAQGDKYAKVKGSLTATQLEYIALTNESGQKTDNKAIANAMTQIFVGALNNPLLAQALGPDQSIQLLNQIIKWLGLPEDFRLRVANNGQNPQQMEALAQDVSQAILKANQETMKQLDEAMKVIGAKLKEVSDKTDATVQKTDENSAAIQKIIEIIDKLTMPNITPAPQPTPPNAYDSVPGTSPNGALAGPPNPSMAIAPGGGMV